MKFVERKYKPPQPEPSSSVRDHIVRRPAAHPPSASAFLSRRLICKQSTRSAAALPPSTTEPIAPALDDLRRFVALGGTTPRKMAERCTGASL
jgi:hypothetical protein